MSKYGVFSGSYFPVFGLNSDKFKLEVSDKLSIQDLSTMDYKNFKDTIIDSLNKHAPLKRKYLRANHSNFITKELSKAIMQRSKLRNLYLKVRSDENRIRCKKQRNNNNKKFWKRVKPLFGNKVKGNPNIALVESNDLITDEKSLAETFNNYFVNVVSNLGINILDDKSGKGDVSNYDNHPSIITIKQHITDKNKVFSFRKVTKDEISSAIKTLNHKKPHYLMTCLPKSFNSLVIFLRIFFIITSIVA